MRARSRASAPAGRGRAMRTARRIAHRTSCGGGQRKTGRRDRENERILASADVVFLMDRRASIVGFSLLLLQSGVYAQTPTADTPDAPTTLKLAPMLLPPPPTALKPGLEPERDA